MNLNFPYVFETGAILASCVVEVYTSPQSRMPVTSYQSPKCMCTADAMRQWPPLRQCGVVWQAAAGLLLQIQKRPPTTSSSSASNSHQLMCYHITHVVRLHSCRCGTCLGHVVEAGCSHAAFVEPGARLASKHSVRPKCAHETCIDRILMLVHHTGTPSLHRTLFAAACQGWVICWLRIILQCAAHASRASPVTLAVCHAHLSCTEHGCIL